MMMVVVAGKTGTTKAVMEQMGRVRERAAGRVRYIFQRVSREDGREATCEGEGNITVKLTEVLTAR